MDLMDYHIHTKHSFDSNSEMRSVCVEAKNRGMKEICFTEHFSVNPINPTYGYLDFQEYFADIKKCREEFGESLVIRAGIELCEPHLMKEKFAEALNVQPLDFILGSVHNIREQKLLTLLLQDEDQDVYRDYFTEVLRMVEHADIDGIAHLDLLKRYAFDNVGTYGFESYREQLEAILKAAIERNIGMEINTSGLRGPLRDTLPSVDVLKLYKHLGGELLTIGSDSHFLNDTGGGIKAAVELAKQCGFRYAYAYEERKPYPLEL